ncbi:UDP-N-acetylmuramoyl-L-alanyl-D-glutamate--2,6-diaminopimelate ligase [Mechercharimyces sp. CAU 1602]|uniref:UDP-N-acetylmuramoyl-L-alanyl-D-glutamate--2, 6-diaminopimelate ligase n=1 Tax=Mechercharimyces sp. CAU 1602 TaxID=2973933 RepID=UPI00216275C2|nr:UDP-N-acetylmuramoyl-L-alanyl-D-glutamate--2,6-diaminopimelate ligase [Mechercharimyces sp. CAU 1602]MCS1350620.1 UDP-N-acetylmuramoyl-L-alanyl-D-glutamate--2,6-diaminopimelate ligase [Mechercharimyces sp. CAU 1602]
MRLDELVKPLLIYEERGLSSVDITGIQTDSRKVESGDLFIALRGFDTDGHQYIEQAVRNGASAVVSEEEHSYGVASIRVPNSRRAMAVLAAHFYDYPSRDIKVIGITGTNGKTTTAHLVQRILADAGQQTGLFGTNGIHIGEEIFPTANTTPDVEKLQQGLARMREVGCTYAVMEVSSHALSLGRTHGCRYHTAVFTNLTQDHLDFHESMESYRAAKGLLFAQLGNDYQEMKGNVPLAILNRDDESSHYYEHITPAQVLTYAIDHEADVRATDVRVTSEGTSFRLLTYEGTTDVHLQMVGKFSVYNALAAIAVTLREGVPLSSIVKSLQTVVGVDGRFERIEAPSHIPYTVLVDYAHTPDSLSNVLSTIQGFAAGRVLCIIGCGGDRDRSKRPLMAQIAVHHSDVAIFTSDNPRSESPLSILEDMVKGVHDSCKDHYHTIVDRREAIRTAMSLARAGDVILIAGKGHETYQEVNGVRFDFDDRQVVREIWQGEEGM